VAGFLRNETGGGGKKPHEMRNEAVYKRRIKWRKEEREER